METVDDETSLREALQQIDDWDTDFAQLLGLEDLAPPPSQSTVRRRRRPNAKQERLELQQQLDELQRTVASFGATSSPSRNADVLWTAIAERQRAQRFAGEVTNSKLRQALKGERECARRLAALANKVSTIGTALGSSPEARIDSYNGPQLEPQVHLQRLEGLTRDAQVMFSSGRFAENTGRDFRDVDYQNFGQDGLLIQLSVSWVLPFNVESVVEALWFHNTRMPRMERTTSFKDLYAAESTLVSRFVSEAKVLGTIDADRMQPVGWSTHGQIATRYESLSPGGAVLLVSNMDVKNYQEAGSCRSVMQGNGFVLVEPLAPSGSTSTPMCRVKWCRRVQGCAPNGSADAIAEYAQLAHHLTSRAMREKWWSSIELNLQAIENTLFDAAHGHRPLGKTTSCAAVCLGSTSSQKAM